MTSAVHSGAQTVLVVGADGQLGRALIQALRETGRPVLGTTRRSDRLDGSTVHLDVADPRSELRLDGVASAVICAGVTSIAACARDPLGSAETNVTGIARLGEMLSEAGVHTLYLSSDAVFDGRMPRPGIDDPTRPTSEYGRQKRRAEILLSERAEEVGIVRFSKILPPDASLFRQWAVDLLAGRRIEPFSDARFAPLSLGFALDVVVRAVAGRVRGVLHASASRDISYADAAVRLASRLEVDPALVRPVAAARSGQPPFPDHTAMDTSTLRLLGLEAPDPFDAIERIELLRASWMPHADPISLVEGGAPW